MPGNQSRENGKKGGRPKGTKNPETLMREEVLKNFRQKTMEVSDHLFSSQLALARGRSFLYKIEKYYKGAGKERRLVKKPPKLVTDQWEIEAYLGMLVEEGELNDPQATYYFIVTREPNIKAIDSLLDRAFGKPVQSINFSDEEGNSIIDEEVREKSRQAIKEVIN